MARPRRVPLGDVEVVILRDGVYPFEDVRKDKGDTVTVDAATAEILIGNGHARRA
jgi:hypothetical protein